jgi:hypothetical protein
VFKFGLTSQIQMNELISERSSTSHVFCTCFLSWICLTKKQQLLVGHNFSPILKIIRLMEKHLLRFNYFHHFLFL